MRHDPIKARLLEAAGEEFAAKGYDGATIRSISMRAGMNVAAVNYHFGDKERLHEAAVVEAHACMAERGGPDPEETGPADDRLRGFVRQFLLNVMGPRGGWHDALMIREMLQPTSACDRLVREMIRPRFEALMAILRDLDPGLEGRRLHATAFSVVGQCLHYKAARPISTRLVGDSAYEALDVDFLTDHIAGLVLAGVARGAGDFEPARAVSEQGGG